jgi:hypothetical protein
MRCTSMFLTMTALPLGAALAQAAESIQVAGELTCKTTEQHAVPVEGDPVTFWLCKR